MAIHSNLTGADLHEPKGVSTATIGQLYLANGSGSGAWTTYPNGWGYYQDSKVSPTVQTINTTASVLEIDGAGSDTDVTNLPLEIRGSSNLWDTTNDLITPISEDDLYITRWFFNISAKSGSPTLLTCELDVSGAVTPTTIIETKYIEQVSLTAPIEISFNTLNFVTSDFNTNGAQLFLKTDTGSVDIDQASVTIFRLFGGSGF